jgi:hypothetical protein
MSSKNSVGSLYVPVSIFSFTSCTSMRSPSTTKIKEDNSPVSTWGFSLSQNSQEHSISLCRRALQTPLKKRIDWRWRNIRGGGGAHANLWDLTVLSSANNFLCQSLRFPTSGREDMFKNMFLPLRHERLFECAQARAPWAEPRNRARRRDGTTGQRNSYRNSVRESKKESAGKGVPPGRRKSETVRGLM